MKGRRRHLLRAAAVGAGLVLAWEALWWARRRIERTKAFAMARTRADTLGRKLVVVGSPDGGVTAGYGCGDVTVDIAPASVCPNYLSADITKPLPFPDNSVVVFVSCVLEYVADYQGAVAELERISGGELYVVRVEPWTLTSLLYPGAKRTVPSTLQPVRSLSGLEWLDLGRRPL